MLTPFPHGKTVTVVPQTADRFGDRTPGATVTVPGCAVYETAGVEKVAGEDTLIYGVTVLFPPTTSVTHTDRVIVDGVEYEVVSQPLQWVHPITGTNPCVQVNLRRVS